MTGAIKVLAMTCEDCARFTGPEYTPVTVLVEEIGEGELAVLEVMEIETVRGWTPGAQPRTR